MKSSKLGVILVGQESSPGAGASSYIPLLVKLRPNLTPEATKIDRSDLMLPYWSPQPSDLADIGLALSFSMELYGGGVDGSDNVLPPPYEPLILAAAMVKHSAAFISASSWSGTFKPMEAVSDGGSTVGYVAAAANPYIVLYDVGTISAGDTLTGEESGASLTVGSVETGLAYRPTSMTANIPTAAVRYWQDGIDQYLYYVLGTFSVSWEVKNVPQISFEIKGLYTDPTDSSNPAPDLQLTKVPKCLGVYAALEDMPADNCLISFDFNLGAEITVIDCMQSSTGRKGFRISGRNPNGSIKPMATDIAQFDPWSKWKEGVPLSFIALAGQERGNKVGITFPGIVYDEVSYDDRDNKLIYNLPFTPTGTKDNEAWLLFF